MKYKFTATLWKYSGPAAWYFVSLPEEMSKEIRSLIQRQEEGWGRMKARATIGNSEWKTAIWFDTKLNTYILPIKAEVRKKEHLSIDSTLEISPFL